MDYREMSGIIMKRVMPQSYPIGIKILREGESMPEGVARPAKFGIRVAICQWTGLARRWGWVVGALAEDINCAPCLAGFGLKRVKEKKDFAQFIVDMGYFDDLDSAMKVAGEIELIEPGEVKGVVAFPLANAPVDPDVVLIYGTPAHMTRLTYAYTQSHSKVIHSSTTFGLSCMSAIRPAWRKESTFVIPGRGERMLAGTDDSEMFFSVPIEDLEAVVNAVEDTHRKGLRFPVQGFVLYEPPVIPAMKALEEKLVDP
jgi:uncharacterized protein (DUF169 family)